MKKSILLVVISLFSLALYGQYPPRISSSVSTDLQKFNEFYQYLNALYIDTLDSQKLVDDAIVDVLSKLDPHSAYISADEMKSVNESFEGSFSGIGIEFNLLKDTIIVVNPIIGGPSERVGLLPNDRIVKVDTVNVIGLKQTDVPKYLRGPKGSIVNLEVVRRGETAPLHFRIVRDNIPINTIDASYLVKKGVGYIKVNRFAHTTMKEFYEAFDKLGKVDALVLDLRGNGGGILEQAIEMSNFFLPQGALIVSTEGRAIPPAVAHAQFNGKFIRGKVVVLIDEYSASGSEIVAGALQDWDRGVIIGRRSFGKGLVQRQFLLKDGSAVRITVAKYLTPTGRAIQRPFEKGKKDDYYTDRIKSITSGEDSLHITDTVKYETLISHRTVYGGGGIYPDIYIPADTSGYTDYFASLVRKGVINEFVIDYLDGYREKIEKQYPTVSSYVKDFDIDQEMIDALVALGVSREVKEDAEALTTSLSEIKIRIKALIAQKLWTTNEYFIVVNGYRDDEFSKALDVLANWGSEVRVK